MAFGKDLKLPKGEVKKLAKTVFKNKNKNYNEIFSEFLENNFTNLKTSPLGVLLKFKVLQNESNIEQKSNFSIDYRCSFKIFINLFIWRY